MRRAAAVVHCAEHKHSTNSWLTHDARHEKSNKLAQNMFQGKDPEELRMAFTIVDDVYALRKKVFTERSLNDRLDEISVVVPDYEKNALLLRCELREAGYFEKPLENIAFKSIEGENLHEDLQDLFMVSRKRREADVLNAFRFSDFTMAYNSKSKLNILSGGASKKRSEKEIKDEILILIHMIDDPDSEIVMRDAFDKVACSEKEVLETFLELLVTKEYQTIYDLYQ